jgi:hypothetical protein
MSGIHYTVMLKVPCLEDVCGSGDIAPHNLQAPAANIGIQLEFVVSRSGDMTPVTHLCPLLPGIRPSIQVAPEEQWLLLQTSRRDGSGYG